MCLSPREYTGVSTWALAGFLVFKLAINTIVRAIYPFLPAIARGLGISLPAAGALVSIRWAASMGAPFVVGTIGRRRPPTALMVLGASLFSLGSIVTAATGVFRRSRCWIHSVGRCEAAL